ncbi:hypothetical protein SLEP1_g9364 [Rubroshorea leprosula]|uniref:SWIM-type domain-containing protein n=1 Tax=Rubroshorea leprosula TaxID=152421 RepID=A0AAV5IFN6_9ROSI|nr:hypothetical protein SLEP1_g9364 [Rubroshorea leprosula]
MSVRGEDNILLKYFLPGNKRTLITICKEKDLQRMIDFIGDYCSVDVFIMSEEVAARNMSILPIMPTSRYKKNDNLCVTVKCKAQGCPWQIYASTVATTQLIRIKKMNSKHTCKGAAVKAGYQSTRGWAWRAKEIAREQLQGSFKEAYAPVPFFCEKIKETNPGSISTFTTMDDSSFLRLFVSFHASMSGFQRGYRPLIFLESTPLNSKYQGNLLSATVADADDDIQNGLEKALAKVFDKCYHSYCLHHLAEKLNRELHEGFQYAVDNIKGISSDAYNLVIQSKPEHWANAFFGGARYNHTTSNFGQPFYSWVSEASELPITQMIDKDAVAHLLQVLLTEGNIFEVWEESVEVVDIDLWDCSCKGWQLTGLPCCHAIAVLECTGRNPNDYFSKYLTTESYCLTYAESIHPVPNVDLPDQDESAHLTVIVTPPPSSHLVGQR